MNFITAGSESSTARSCSSPTSRFRRRTRLAHNPGSRFLAASGIAPLSGSGGCLGSDCTNLCFEVLCFEICQRRDLTRAFRLHAVLGEGSSLFVFICAKGRTKDFLHIIPEALRRKNFDCITPTQNPTPNLEESAGPK